jgi:hypothetical protein
VPLTAGAPAAKLPAASGRARTGFHVPGDDHPHDLAPVRDVAPRDFRGLQIVIGFLLVVAWRGGSIVLVNFVVVQIVVGNPRWGWFVGCFGPRRSGPFLATRFSGLLASTPATAAPPTATSNVGRLVLFSRWLPAPIPFDSSLLGWTVLDLGFAGSIGRPIIERFGQFA